MRRESSLRSSKLPHCALMELRGDQPSVEHGLGLALWLYGGCFCWNIVDFHEDCSKIMFDHPWTLGSRGASMASGYRNCLLAHRVRLFLSRLVKVVVSSTGNNCDGRIAGCWTCFVGSVPKLPHDGFSHLFTKFQGMQSTNRHTDEAWDLN